MILTVTPNPTIDRTIFVRNFRLGELARAEREVVTPSGKGVGASLVIDELGGKSIAVGLMAGHTGRHLLALLEARGIRFDFLPATGETRTAIVLVDLALGRQSTISTATLSADERALGGLLERVAHHAGHCRGLILAGSLPPGLPVESYARLLQEARAHGLLTLLDSSGEPLRRGVEGRPAILKINWEELQALEPQRAGPDELASLGARLAPRLGEWASEALIVTLGERGALAVTGEGWYHARPPEVSPVSTAGAGDALAAGLMLARSRGEGWEAALTLGSAAAASTVMNEGTALCRRQEVEQLRGRVQVRRIG